MKRILSLLIGLFGSIIMKGEIIHGTASSVTWPTYSYNLEVYIPDNTTGLLPAVIFIPGNGEVGTDRNKLYVHGPLKFIRDNGWKPNFIVVGAQPAGPWPNQIVVERFLLELFTNPIYRINQNKWYLTGLSGGADGIFLYIKNQPNATFIAPKAIVPFSYTKDAACGNFYDGSDYLCGTDLRYINIPTWGLAGWYDSHHDKMKRFVQLLIQAGYPARWTSYKLPMNSTNQPFSGHCCWNTYYSPDYKENINGINMNIYEWMLQYPLVSLPVNFLYFNHTFLRDSIEFKWGISQVNGNNNRFELEESSDGISWKTVGVIPIVNGITDYRYLLKK